MYTSTVLLALIPTAFGAAQYGNSGSSDSSSTAASSASAPTDIPGVHTVKVSNLKGDLSFTPNEITAVPGETIEFVFYPQQHSVVQSSFAAPCQPLNQTKGFFSGKYPVAAGQIGTDVYTITVNDTKPIWFYCGTGKHCQNGMVGVINAPADKSKTLDMFKTSAKAAVNNTEPAVIQGGTKVSASDVKSPTATGTAFSTPTGAADFSRGSIQWGLLGLTGAIAAGVGGLIV